jgi:hypothetical protein
MVLIQLLLPTTLVPGPNRNNEALARTHEELIAQFSGLTTYTRSPALGFWTAPDGRGQEDTVIMVEVVTDHFDRQWWRAYVAALRERFAQEAIHVRALPIQMVDEQAS